MSVENNPNEIADADCSLSLFEQELLFSAQADAPAHSLDKAWNNFSAGVGALSQGLASQDSFAAPPPAIETPRGVSFPATTGLAVRCWILGALVGAGSSAYWLLSRDRPIPPLPPTVVEVPRTVPSSLTLRPESSAVPPIVVGKAAPRASLRTVHRTRRVSSPITATRKANLSTATLPHSTSSTLRAEIQFLDAARNASRRGHFSTALQKVEDYRREFPNGALVADAEVVAIDALIANNKRELARERSRLFLSRHPDDPHARRLRRVLTTDLGQK